jgi:hypothetical protein
LNHNRFIRFNNSPDRHSESSSPFSPSFGRLK